MRATDALESLVKQSLGVVAILVGSVIALSEGAAWAPAVTLAAAIVLSGLALVGLEFAWRKRDRALDLVLEGRGQLPVAAVQHQRRRLRARRTRSALARSFAAMILEATHPPKLRPRGQHPLFDVEVVAAVADDLRVVILLLRDDDAGARGVALAERLLTDGGSPLYGHQVEQLREQLQRVRELFSE